MDIKERIENITGQKAVAMTPSDMITIKEACDLLDITEEQLHMMAEKEVIDPPIDGKVFWEQINTLALNASKIHNDPIINKIKDVITKKNYPHKFEYSGIITGYEIAGNDKTIYRFTEANGFEFAFQPGPIVEEEVEEFLDFVHDHILKDLKERLNVKEPIEPQLASSAPQKSA